MLLIVDDAEESDERNGIERRAEYGFSRPKERWKSGSGTGVGNIAISVFYVVKECETTMRG